VLGRGEKPSFMFDIVLKKCLPFSSDPSGPPQNVSAITNSSSSIILYWLPPRADQQNGEIRSYTIKMRGDDLLYTMNNSTTLPVTGLQAYTNYTFFVRAVNDKGVGPYSSPIINRTFEAGKGTLFTSSVMFVVALVMVIGLSGVQFGQLS